MPRAESGLDFRRVGSLSDKPLAVIFSVVRRLGRFSCTLRAGESVLSFVGRKVFLTRLALKFVSLVSESGVCLTRPALESVSSFVG